VRYGSIGGLEYEVPQSRLYCLCINGALCSTALLCICRVIRRSPMTMKRHTYYIIFGRPPIGGKLPPSPVAAPLVPEVAMPYSDMWQDCQITFPHTRPCYAKSSYRSIDPQTLHGNVHQVDHVPNGPTNSAAITTMFPLRLCGGKLLVAVTRERRYGPSRLRVDDDDDSDDLQHCRPHVATATHPRRLSPSLPVYT